MYSDGPLHMAEQKQGDQLESTYGNSVRIRDVGLTTCRKRWTIRRGGERESEISVARQDDDDDDDSLVNANQNSVTVILFRIDEFRNIFFTVISVVIVGALYKKRNKQ